jgi:hypothetical protein
MLTKDEIEKRLARDEETYTKLTKERRNVYQRIRRYRNMLYHMNQMEMELGGYNGCNQ